MKKIREFFKHEWIKNISWTVIGGGILSFLLDLYQKTPIFASLLLAFKYIGRFLTIPIPLYSALIILISLPLVWILLQRIRNIRFLNQANNHYLTASEVKMLNYTADKFSHNIWKWEWKHNELLKRYEPRNISPICPNEVCNNEPMVEHGFDDEFGCYLYKCLNCNQITGLMEQTSDVADFIERKDYSS